MCCLTLSDYGSIANILMLLLAVITLIIVKKEWNKTKNDKLLNKIIYTIDLCNEELLNLDFISKNESYIRDNNNNKIVKLDKNIINELIKKINEIINELLKLKKIVILVDNIPKGFNIDFEYEFIKISYDLTNLMSCNEGYFCQDISNFYVVDINVDINNVNKKNKPQNHKTPYEKIEKGISRRRTLYNLRNGR